MEGLDATYDDLVGDITRYSAMSVEQVHEQYPEMSPELLICAMRMADECPHCLRRFVNLTNKHESGCPVPDLIRDIAYIPPAVFGRAIAFSPVWSALGDDDWVRRYSALQGQLLDADDSVVFDYFKEFERVPVKPLSPPTIERVAKGIATHLGVDVGARGMTIVNVRLSSGRVQILSDEEAEKIFADWGPEVGKISRDIAARADAATYLALFGKRMRGQSNALIIADEVDRYPAPSPADIKAEKLQRAAGYLARDPTKDHRRRRKPKKGRRR